jgi:hypothetical protein
MATPRRPIRPGGASSRRAPPPQEEEYVEGEEGELLEEELPPAKPQGPSVTMMVGVGAALLFSILLLYAVFSKRGFMIEVENTSDLALENVVVNINGDDYQLGNFRPNEINSAEARCSPGNDVKVSFKVPNRQRTTKTLPKVDKEGKPLELDFREYHGRCRIRVQPGGIEEVEY